MIFLLLAIVCSAALPLLFRAFNDWRVNLFWAIPANYFVCILVGGIFAPPPHHASELLSRPWVVLAILQGLILALNFYLLAYVVLRVGGFCVIAGPYPWCELVFARLYRAAGGRFRCGSGESAVGGDPGDPGFRPLWRFVERREDRRPGNRPVVTLSLHGDRPGFWRYSCVVTSRPPRSRVRHVRVSFHPAEVHPGTLPRQLLQSPVRHDVLSIRFRNKRDSRARKDSGH